MSDVKLREAFEFVKVVRNTFSGDMAQGFITRDKQYAVDLLSEALDLAAEALAQPDEAVELTDEEIAKVWNTTPDDDEGESDIYAFARAVIAAHEAKRIQS